MPNLLDQAGGSRSEFVKLFSERVFSQRVPLSGLLEVTSRCNLRCVHCYLGPQEEQHRKRASEMSTAEILSLIDQMAAAGTYELTITGGDPMMRPDFPEIYRHAVTSGMRVEVFCDAILVTDRIVELFRQHPPMGVEVSIYGATAETYEKVTRVPGSFAKFLAGIRRLLDASVRVGLKSVLMSLNKHEFGAMEKMANDWGVPFRFDAAIFPCLPDRSAEPLDLRVAPQEVIAIEMASPQRRDVMVRTLKERGNLAPTKDIYYCGAGVTGFYVDPFGDLSPCLLTTRYRYSVRGEEGAFAKRWREDVGELRSRRSDNHACGSCEVRAMCSGCAGLWALESGREDVKSEYVCQTTQLRVQAIQQEIERREGRVFLRVTEQR